MAITNRATLEPTIEIRVVKRKVQQGKRKVTKDIIQQKWKKTSYSVYDLKKANPIYEYMWQDVPVVNEEDLES